MARILIGFFCSDNAENIAPFLFGRYDRAFYVSFEGEGPDSRSKEVLETLINERFGAQAAFLTAEEKTLGCAYRLLYDLTCGEGEYVIDITGGPGLFSAAAGIYISSNEKKNVHLATFDIKTCRETLHYPCPQTKELSDRLGVDELISLSGGAVISSSKTMKQLADSSSLRTETVRMWDTVKGASADWNRFCSMPNFREGAYVRKKLSRADDKKTSERITALLRKRGIIKNDRTYVSQTGRTFAEYELCPKAKTIELYEKSGTALEMFSFIAAAECGAFSDAATGVLLDLDGLITKKKGDPRNEIDLAAVYGERLVLASCKCTKPTKEYLYEILTMAKQYGGRHSIPMLICSEPSFEPVRERAKEMGVVLIDNASNMSLKILKDEFLKYFPAGKD